MRGRYDPFVFRGVEQRSLTVSTGPSPAAMATIASGNTIRIPNTAKAMPHSRKRCCQTSSISLSTEAFTTALSKLSEISSTERTTMIHRTCAVPATLPVLAHPYQSPSARHTSVNTIEKR